MAAMDNIWQVALALVGIIALIVALGYVARRMQHGRTQGGGQLQVVDSTFLGPKERLLLIRVHGNDVLIGMNAQCIARLGQFPSQEEPESFAGVLKEATAGASRS